MFGFGAAARDELTAAHHDSTADQRLMRLTNVLLGVLTVLLIAAMLAVRPEVWVWMLFRVAVVVLVGMLSLTRRG